MSYALVDHAGWVERNMAVVKSLDQRRQGAAAARASAGRGWRNGPEKLTAFQAKAFDILGMVLGGIYNARIDWDEICWFHGSHESIAVPVVSRGMSTFDTQSLTLFVLLCHAARIRGEICPHGPRGFLLILSQRGDQGGTMDRHPDLTEMMAEFEAWLPADHRVWYDQPAATVAATEAAE
ncbi:MAG: hypothetical protein J0H82_05995 [Alphaproteobacteria bacterium]|jgi:hypothetical protein|nr:hypothetical protein [Alphaproteobacteria bacterium]